MSRKLRRWSRTQVGNEMSGSPSRKPNVGAGNTSRGVSTVVGSVFVVALGLLVGLVLLRGNPASTGSPPTALPTSAAPGSSPTPADTDMPTWSPPAPTPDESPEPSIDIPGEVPAPGATLPPDAPLLLQGVAIVDVARAAQDEGL